MKRIGFGIPVLVLLIATSIPLVQASPVMQITDTTCSYFDQTGKHLEKNAISKSKYLKDSIQITCISDIANTTNEVIKYTPHNNPFGKVIPCSFQEHITFDWTQTINPSGLMILECSFNEINS